MMLFFMLNAMSRKPRSMSAKDYVLANVIGGGIGLVLAGAFIIWLYW